MAKWMIVLLMVCGGLLVGWQVFDESPPTVHITAEEFRFSPSEVKLKAFQNVPFVVRNQGREPHTFQASFFDNQAVHILWRGTVRSIQSNESVRLIAGQSVSFIGRFPPGVYPFRCVIQGHRGMEGVLIVQNEV